MKSLLCSALLVSFILSVNVTIAQSNTNPCGDLRSPEEIDIELAQLGGISKDSKAKWEKLLRARFEYINCLFSNGDPEIVERYLESTEELLPGGSDILPSVQLLYYAYLGRLKRINNNIEEALNIYQKGEQLIDKYSNRINPKDKSILYDYIGIAFASKGDYHQGIKYIELGLNALGERQKKYQEDKIIFLNKMGRLASRTGDYNDVLEYFKRAKRIVRRLPTQEKRAKQIIRINLDFATACYEMERYDQSISLAREAVDLASNTYEEVSEKMEDVYYLAIKVAMVVGDYDFAIFCIKKYLNISKLLSSKKRLNFSEQYAQLANCYMYKEDYDSAKKYLKQAEDSYAINVNDAKPYLGTKVSKSDYLYAFLFHKCLIHLRAYEKSKDIDELYTVTPYNQLAINTIEEIFREIESYASKYYFVDRYHAYFEIAVWTHYYLYAETDSLKYLDQAFSFAERSKAMLLKASVGQAGAEQLFALPQDLSDRWKGLKAQVVELERELYRREQSGEAGTLKLKEKVARANRAAYLLEDSLRQRYPDHFKLHYVPEPLTTAEIQRELLQEDEAIVHYFVGRFRMYIFTFTREDASMAEVEVPPSMTRDVMALRENIYAWPFAQSDSLLTAYRERAYSLYQLMFEPIADQLPEKVLIIPDDILEYLPFEALLYDTVADATTAISDYPFLINRHQLSYTHSLQLTVEMSQLELNPDKRKVLAYAPVFKGTAAADMTTRQRDLGPIVNNVREVETIGNLFPTDARIGREATLERFLEEAADYSVLHLATHAKANDEKGEYSYLAFTEIPDTLQNEILYASGLYTQPLNADMVVLSACEGGIGQMRHGEGAITLARAFAHAGVRSTVTSLWRVDDASAADLMTGFYEQLKEDKPKDEALRAAKLSFLHENGGARAHPFYWAAFVASGNMEPLDLGGGSGSWIWWLLGIGVLVLVVLRSRRA